MMRDSSCNQARKIYTHLNAGISLKLSYIPLVNTVPCVTVSQIKSLWDHNYGRRLRSQCENFQRASTSAPGSGNMKQFYCRPADKTTDPTLLKSKSYQQKAIIDDTAWSTTPKSCNLLRQSSQLWQRNPLEPESAILYVDSAWQYHQEKFDIGQGCQHYSIVVLVLIPSMEL